MANTSCSRGDKPHCTATRFTRRARASTASSSTTAGDLSDRGDPMMTSNAAISDSKMAMATDSDVGSTSVTIWPRQLPPHWANRISARHSSADKASLKKSR